MTNTESAIAMEDKKMEARNDEVAMDDEVEMKVVDHSLYPPLNGNELYGKWKVNRNSLPDDFSRILDPELDEDRRGDLFEAEDEEAMEKYAWAIPDERALRIISAFGPLVELGAGAGYWARLLRDRGVMITCYDKDVGEDSKAAGVPAKPWTQIEKGGPEFLSLYPFATLVLIYPDDYDVQSDEPLSMSCLKHFAGDTVVHIGEWLGSSVTLSMEGQGTPDEAFPWGRSTSVQFQLAMEASFHKVLQVPLPNWGSVRNTLTVWKRTKTVVLEGDRYGYIPEDERLEVTVASPSMQHLLNDKDE